MSYLSKSKWISRSSGIAMNSRGAGRTGVATGSPEGAAARRGVTSAAGRGFVTEPLGAPASAAGGGRGDQWAARGVGGGKSMAKARDGPGPAPVHPFARKKQQFLLGPPAGRGGGDFRGPKEPPHLIPEVCERLVVDVWGLALVAHRAAAHGWIISRHDRVGRSALALPDACRRSGSTSGLTAASAPPR